MSIFESLDRLMRDVTIVNESEEKTAEIEIDSRCETPEQARTYIRTIFGKHYFKEKGPKPPKRPTDDSDEVSEWPGPPMPVGGLDLPSPFDDKEKGSSGHGFDDIEWEDIPVEKINDDEDEDDIEEEEPDDEDDLFDDFGEETKGSSGSGSSGGSGGDDEPDDEDEEGEDGEGEDGTDGTDGTDGGESGRKGPTGPEGGESGEDGPEGGEPGKSGKKGGKPGESGEDGPEGGEPGEPGEDGPEGGKGKPGKPGKDGKDGKSGDGDEGDPAYERFKDELNDALSKASEIDGTHDVRDLSDKIDKLGDMKGKRPSERMKELRKKIDEKSGEGDAPVGSVMGETTDEDLKKELEKHGYSGKDIEANTEAKNAKTPIPDEKMEKIREEAIKGFEKRSKGASKISASILYKALKNRGFTEGAWEELIEKIIKEKSKKSGKADNKHKTVRLGNKNHLWRGSILPTYKNEPGNEKKKIYCFVDWSGSVTGVKGLIESFLGKVIHVSEKLDYTDMDVYGFAEKLSLPRTIAKEMREKDGLATILADTRSYMDTQHLGFMYENFAAVAHEINRIKAKDDESIIFIFGDGIWTFYGNSQPPVRLREICPEHRDDIFAFIFYNKVYRSEPYYWDEILHEVAAVTDRLGAGLGTDHVIMAPLEDISK